MMIHIVAIIEKKGSHSPFYTLTIITFSDVSTKIDRIEKTPIQGTK